jgi:hypothetical protein
VLFSFAGFMASFGRMWKKTPETSSNVLYPCWLERLKETTKTSVEGEIRTRDLPNTECFPLSRDARSSFKERDIN